MGEPGGDSVNSAGGTAAQLTADSDAVGGAEGGDKNIGVNSSTAGQALGPLGSKEKVLDVGGEGGHGVEWIVAGVNCVDALRRKSVGSKKGAASSSEQVVEEQSQLDMVERSTNCKIGTGLWGRHRSTALRAIQIEGEPEDAVRAKAMLNAIINGAASVASSNTTKQQYPCPIARDFLLDAEKIYSARYLAKFPTCAEDMDVRAKLGRGVAVGKNLALVSGEELCTAAGGVLGAEQTSVVVVQEAKKASSSFSIPVGKEPAVAAQDQQGVGGPRTYFSSVLMSSSDHAPQNPEQEFTKLITGELAPMPPEHLMQRQDSASGLMNIFGNSDAGLPLDASFSFDVSNGSPASGSGGGSPLSPASDQTPSTRATTSAGFGAARKKRKSGGENTFEGLSQNKRFCRR